MGIETEAMAPRPTEADGSSRGRLLLVLAALYFAQAVPAYLVVTAAVAIMRAQDVSPAAIGLVGLLLLPTMLKFLWAPLVERRLERRPGARRGFIRRTQCGILLCLLALSFVPPADILRFLAVAMVLSILLATQDVAVDGHATRRLRPADRPAGNAIQAGAVAAGVIVGGSAALLLYDAWGWQATVLVVAALSALPLAAAAFLDEAPAPPDGGQASLRAFFARPTAVRLLLLTMLYRASEGLLVAMEGPYLVEQGLSLSTIGLVTGTSAALAGLFGAILAGVLIARTGARTMLAVAGLFRTVLFLWFMLHAAGLVDGQAALIAAVIVYALIRSAEIVALFCLFMAEASPAQPGTDFTVLVCAQALVYAVGALVSGVVAETFGYGWLFAAAAGLSAGAAIVFLRSPAAVRAGMPQA
jgi:MFS transporter (putative signal transducer)